MILAERGANVTAIAEYALLIVYASAFVPSVDPANIAICYASK